MANDTSTGYAGTANVSNVQGAQVLTFSAIEYPFLSRVAGRMTSQSDTYSMSAAYTHQNAAQPAITEAASVTAPTAIAYEREEEKNKVQIFQETVSVTYAALSSSERLKIAEDGTSGSGYTASPLRAAVANELAFQTARAQEKLYRDLEYTLINGAGTTYKTKGILTACTTSTVGASSAALSKGLVDELLQEMAAAGAYFRRPTIFANAFQRSAITKLYEYVPADRNVGGASIGSIITDFGVWEVVYDRFMPTNGILFADMAYVNVVTKPTPGKDYMPDGLFLMEELAKTGAAERYQLYGELGIDYGSEKLHGSITGLAIS